MRRCASARRSSARLCSRRGSGSSPRWAGSCSAPRTAAGLGGTLLLAGIVLFAIVVLFQTVTLPVEFDASRRALAALKSQGLLSAAEVPAARSVLNAAALAYVAGFLSAVGQLLYFVMLFAGGRRN